MAKITFKAKVQTMYSVDDKPLYQFVQVPTLTRKHCDMAAFRQHPKYGPYANSDMFPNMLARIRCDLFRTSGQRLRLDQLEGLPGNVTVDTSGFLAVVTITV